MFIDDGGGDYSLHSDSPCVDAGQPPGEFGGFPCQDLERRPRLLDADGNHLAQPDMGAYELSTPGLVPGEVQGLRWESSVDTLVWDPEPDSEGYNVYRGHGEQLGNANWGGCLDQVPATELLDEEFPSSGQLFFYLVCGVLGLQEGTMGFANCVERSNFAPCIGF